MDSCTHCEFLNYCKKNKIAFCPENIITCCGSFFYCDKCTKKERSANRKNGIFCKHDKIDYINGIVTEA